MFKKRRAPTFQKALGLLIRRIENIGINTAFLQNIGINKVFVWKVGTYRICGTCKEWLLKELQRIMSKNYPKLALLWNYSHDISTFLLSDPSFYLRYLHHFSGCLSMWHSVWSTMTGWQIPRVPTVFQMWRMWPWPTLMQVQRSRWMGPGSCYRARKIWILVALWWNLIHFPAILIHILAQDEILYFSVFNQLIIYFVC